MLQKYKKQEIKISETCFKSINSQKRATKSQETNMKYKQQNV